VTTIGVMKAVGGSRWQIARIYFGQALLVGISALILALPAGIWGSRVLCRYLAVFLNFDINSFAVPAWVYLFLAVVGIVVPLLAAAYPIWKGTRVSVREALADYGVGRNAFGVSAFDRAMARIGGTARPLLLAIRNSFRRRARLVLTLVTLAAGGLFFMSALNIRTSLIHTLDRLFATMQFDLSVNLGTMQSLEKVERAVRNTPGVSRVEGWIAIEGMISGATNPPAGNSPSTSVPSSSSASGGHGGGGHGGGGGGHGGGGGGGDRFSVVALPTDS
jgi:putative ABC transport system permease protein